MQPKAYSQDGQASLLKKRLWYRCFPVNFAKFFKNTFFSRTPPVAAPVYTNWKHYKNCFQGIHKEVTDTEGVNKGVYN